MKTHVLGSDEVGLGPLAGPLVVCAVLFPHDLVVEGLKDSKRLSKKQIKLLAQRLPRLCVEHAFAQVEAHELDCIGLNSALRNAHTKAIKKVLQKTEVPEDSIRIVVDGNVEHCPSIEGVQYLVRADTQIPAVMAGAVLAKFARDQLMQKYHEQYPEFGFRLNAGYGTPLHIDALKRYGASPIHRRLCELVRRYE